MRDLRGLSRQLLAKGALLGTLALAFTAGIVAHAHSADLNPGQICNTALIGGNPYAVVLGKTASVAQAKDFSIEDLEFGFRAAGHLENRSLEIIIELVDHQERRRSAIRGAEAFAKIVAHFGAQNISVIQGVWTSGDNLETYTRARLKGESPKDAARRTWTGRQAALHGFTDVRSVLTAGDDTGEWGVRVEFVKPMKAVTGDYRLEKSPYVFEWTDKRNGFYFRGRLIDGKLAIDTELESESRGLRSEVRGADLCGQMIAHFGVGRIRVIQGIWSAGTNYQQYSTYLRQGFDEEDAARYTWAGRQASRYGFTEVSSVKNAEGWNNQSYIDVEFTKPR